MKTEQEIRKKLWEYNQARLKNTPERKGYKTWVKALKWVLKDG